jgi:transcriptional regulator with XRE-family HTH domain
MFWYGQGMTLTLPIEAVPSTEVDVEAIIRFMEDGDIPSWYALAQAAGIGPALAYRIRDGIGSPTLETLAKVAGALGVGVRNIIRELPDDLSGDILEPAPDE